MLDFYPDAASADESSALRSAPGTSMAPRAVRRALDYMHANLAANLRLEDIAAEARLSVFHFSRTFRKATGVGPHRYLTRARVEKVKTLLLSSDSSLAAIADETGFSDQSHMSKVFKKFTGMSPRNFRRGRRVPQCPLQAWFLSQQGTGHVQ